MRVKVPTSGVLASTLHATALLSQGLEKTTAVEQEPVPRKVETGCLAGSEMVTTVLRPEPVVNIAQYAAPIEGSWDAASKRRFKELAVKEALGEITRTEAGELERLTILHRNHESPRTAEEIIWEYHQIKLTNSILAMFQQYDIHLHRRPEAAARSAARTP